MCEHSKKYGKPIITAIQYADGTTRVWADEEVVNYDDMKEGFGLLKEHMKEHLADTKQEYKRDKARTFLAATDGPAAH